ncbi:MAG: hypothetical protein KGO52_12775 [Nitrospirota bacterium]|nr:hypothetical protein [Nitrospirota bacterium]MDE3243584.1 hypothetical protein [Nitrospirota bacterium]
MRPQTISIIQRAGGQGLLLLIAIVAGTSLVPFIQGSAQATMYLCPGKTGETIQIQPGPDCAPLVDQTPPDERRPVKPEISAAVKPGQLESAVSAFMHKYREFLSCCATDLTKKEELNDLEDEASEILKQGDALVGQRFSLVASHGALLLPVAQARNKLRDLRAKKEELYLGRDRANTMDYEAAGRERHRLKEEGAAVEREFQPDKQPSRAPTGKDVGNSRLNDISQTGPALSGTSTFNRDAAVGADAGNSSLDKESRTGTSSVADSPLNNASQTGSALEDTSSLNKSSRIGRDLGGTSTLNKESSTGPSVGDSDLNSR